MFLLSSTLSTAPMVWGSRQYTERWTGSPSGETGCEGEQD